MDLNGLRVFAKVVECNSFSLAARKLEMPLATVSRRVADLEENLGVRLLDRTTRKLRLTDTGSELLDYSRRAAELEEAIIATARNRATSVSGLLRISAPPSIAATLISPICCSFLSLHADVRVQILITERLVDLVGDGVDIAFHVGDLADSNSVAKRILVYRHRVLASPDYLKTAKPIRDPADLLDHRLLAFSRAKPDTLWRFVHIQQKTHQSVRFHAHISMNDYAGIAQALLSNAGVGELPPIVEPGLVEDGRMVEVMPKWRLRTYNLSLVHLGDRHASNLVRKFKDFAAQAAPELFPTLPT